MMHCQRNIKSLNIFCISFRCRRTLDSFSTAVFSLQIRHYTLTLHSVTKLSKLRCSLKARSSESAFLFLNRSWYMYNVMDKEKYVFFPASYLTLIWDLRQPASRPKQDVNVDTLLRNTFYRFLM
jgi:hypothetical protein